MKILTTVKRVVDYEAIIKILPNGVFIDTSHVNMITNPFDEIGVEAALQIKETISSEIVVLSIGSEDNKQNIRSALAMGADRGILVIDSNENNFVDSLYTAKIIFAICKKEKPDLIIMGKQSIDTDNHQVSEMLAEMLNVGNASQANNISIKDKLVCIKKETDVGIETLEMSLPCVISTDLRLNQPRYPSIPGIMKAKRKRIVVESINDLEIPHTSLISIKQMRTQPKKTAVKFLLSIDELMNNIESLLKAI